MHRGLGPTSAFLMLGIFLLLTSPLAGAIATGPGAIGTAPLAPSSPSSPGGAASAVPSSASLVPINVAGGVVRSSEAGVPVSPSQTIEITISLQQQDPSLLSAMIAGQDDANSPYYGQVVSPSLYNHLFAPNPSELRGLEAYLSSYRLSYSQAGTDLMVHGTVAQVEAAFSTQLIGFPTNGAVTTWEPETTPELPASIAPVVSSVIGLNTLLKPTTFNFFPSAIQATLRDPSVAAKSASPHAGITVDLTTATFFLDDAGTVYMTPPTGVNVTFTATVTLPTGDTCAPCVYQWNFGDSGRYFTEDVSATTDSLGHTYVQAANLLMSSAMTITVNVTDTQSSSGQAADAVYPTVNPFWMEKAYGEDPLFAQGYTGQGQYIGLDEECDSTYDTGTSLYNTSADTFASAMGLPTPILRYIGPGTVCPSGDGSDGWSTETMLDIDWAHTMAPNATIVVYFGQSSSGSDITGGDAQWATGTSNVYEASNSWGLSELEAVPTLGTAGPFDATWSQAAVSGVTLYTATGDCGGTMNESYLPSNGPNVSYPADLPNGVAVGGTIVQTDHNGSWLNDWVWNGTTSTTACENNQGTGGGWSQRYAAPTFQSLLSGPGTTPPTPWPVKTPRGLPDVAQDAATFVDIYYAGDTAESEPAGWYPTGGTSLATPMFTATMALVLQALNRHYNSTAPGFLDPAFYKIGEGANYATSFHDVTSGTNADPFGYSATTGWDPCSGWGTPNATGMVQGLASALPVRYPVWGLVEVGPPTVGTPIAGALVNSSNNGGAATSAANGSFTLYLVNGTYTLTGTDAPTYNPNTLAITVNGAPLHGLILYLYPVSGGMSMVVTGVVRSQLGNALSGAYVNATIGPTLASATTSSTGTFLLYLQNGTYDLTGSIRIPDPWINPTFNSTTISVTIDGPASGILIVLYYDLHSLTGVVLSSVTGLPIPDPQVYGFNLIGYQATGNAEGQFAVHLPTGPASLTAAAANYLNATVSNVVNENNTATVIIYLVPAKIYVNQFVVRIKALAPLNATTKIPMVNGEASIPIDVWANNSTTGQPQVGIHIFLSSSVGGNFTSESPTMTSAGIITTEFTAPYATKWLTGILNAEVSTQGWSGTNSTPIQVIPNNAYCGSLCYYPVKGTVIDANGTLLKGATVEILNSGGTATLNHTVTTASGAFSFGEQDGSYSIVASLSGYNTMKAIPFSVKGSSVTGLLLVLKPPAAPTGTGIGFHDAYLYVTPILLGLIAVVAALLLYRRMRRPAQEEESPAKIGETPPPEQLPVDTSVEIIPAPPPPEALPPADEAPPSGSEESPEAPPPSPEDSPPPEIPPQFGEPPSPGTP